MTQVSITSAALSDVGLRREENQDSYLVSDGVFLVADGMGGGVSGQVASATTLEKMNALTTIATRTRTDIDTCLAQAQYAVRDIGERQNAVSGTTLTGLILKDLTTLDSDKNAWYVVNVGDSRTYHLNSLTSGNPEAQRQWDIDSFLQITHDHSERQEAIDSGRLLPDVANRIVPRNIITQAIGSPNGVSPDYFQADLTGRFVICSDGVHSELDDAQIAVITSQSGSPSDITHALMDAAIAEGGHDNITVIVVDVIPVPSLDSSLSDDTTHLAISNATDSNYATIDNDDEPSTVSLPQTAGSIPRSPAHSPSEENTEAEDTEDNNAHHEWTMNAIGPGEDIDSMNDSTLETLRTTQAQNETSDPDAPSPEA